MAQYLGSYAFADVLYHFINTRDNTGPISAFTDEAGTGDPVIKCLRAGQTTDVTVSPVLTKNVGGRNGLHLITIDTSADAEYDPGSGARSFTCYVQDGKVGTAVVTNEKLFTFNTGVWATLDTIADEDRTVLVSTTIATLSTQTSFTLTAGSAEDDAYNGMVAVIEDASTAVQKAVGTVSDYTGSTKTITLSAAPAFTIATSDNVRILASGTGATAANVWARAGADPSSVPGPTASLEDKINWICAMMLNKLTQTSNTMTLRDNADGSDVGTATVADDGTTATRGKFS